jgi:hypothetical protein
MTSRPTASRRLAALGLAGSLAVTVGATAGWLSAASPDVPASVGAATLQVESRPNDAGVASETERPRRSPPKDGTAAPRAGDSSRIRIVDATRLPRPTRTPAPTRVSIPTIGLDVPVRPTGVVAGGPLAGQMALPDDPRILGWYRFGPTVGERDGAAVVAGHVDSRQYGIGPLAALAAVRPGADVVVTRADGRTLRYRVVGVERIAKQALPLDRLFARSGPHRLFLVTCGGAFVPEAGGYTDNVIVTAVPRTLPPGTRASAATAVAG